jgi:hypothetical protein
MADRGRAHRDIHLLHGKSSPSISRSTGGGWQPWFNRGGVIEDAFSEALLHESNGAHHGNRMF